MEGTNLRALLGRSRALRESYEYEGSQRVLNRGLLLYTNDLRLLEQQGLLYSAQEQWDKAERDFQRRS